MNFIGSLARKHSVSQPFECEARNSGVATKYLHKYHYFDLVYSKLSIDMLNNLLINSLIINSLINLCLTTHNSKQNQVGLKFSPSTYKQRHCDQSEIFFKEVYLVKKKIILRQNYKRGNHTCTHTHRERLIVQCHIINQWHVDQWIKVCEQ